MRKSIGVLGELEWTVMRICWKKGKSTARVVFDELLKTKPDVKYQTVKTTLDRLVHKEFLEGEKFGPLCLFTPRVSEKSLTSKAVEKFSRIVFGDVISPVFIHLLKKKKYAHELEELKKIVNEIEED
jgi:BlaI family transcriptional regulator, penicillinase repressor